MSFQVPANPSNPSLSGPFDYHPALPTPLVAAVNQAPAMEPHNYECVYCKQSYPSADVEGAVVLDGSATLCPGCATAVEAHWLSLWQILGRS